MTESAILPNGILLPEEWPPRRPKVPRVPMRPPYLEHPPRPIIIDVGRQLFIDDFLILRTSLVRKLYQPEPHPANPLLQSETEWEVGTAPFALPFSDGVWYDPSDKKYKRWYAGNEMWCTCYAKSGDGIEWHRHSLNVVPGTNIVNDIPQDSSVVWLDENDDDPQKRWKMLQTIKAKTSMVEPLCGHAKGDFFTYTYFTSHDGIHWVQRYESREDQPIGDRSTFWYDPFRKVWIYSIRDISWQLDVPNRETFRVRLYKEHSDLAGGLADLESGTVPWVGADDIDPPHPEYPDQSPQLYNLDGVAYESIMLGMFSVHQGPENNICVTKNIHKRNQIMLGYSRDGFHWSKPDRRPFIRARSEDDSNWDWGNIQSVGGGLLVVGDQLRFYYGGRKRNTDFWDSHGGVGVALLRRDGFAGMTGNKDGGILITRPVQFSGEYLFVNVATETGCLRVGILESDGKDISGFATADCIPVTGDSTKHRIVWKHWQTLGGIAGRPVMFRFELFGGSLYSFWVSRWETGGFMGAGGPDFKKGMDKPKA